MANILRVSADSKQATNPRRGGTLSRQSTQRQNRGAVATGSIWGGIQGPFTLKHCASATPALECICSNQIKFTKGKPTTHPHREFNPDPVPPSAKAVWCKR